MNEQPEAPNKESGKTRSPFRLVGLIVGVLLIVGVAAAFLISRDSGDGGSSSNATANGEEPESKDFEVNTDVSTGAGPQPLKVAFKASTINADGDVTYSWNFDEGGAKAPEPNPTFVYQKQGWKLPKVTARDEGGHVAYASVQIRVWSTALWKKFRSGNATQAETKAIIIANLKAFERKTGGKVPGISAAPLPGQEPLTPESARAQRREPGLIRAAQRREARKVARERRAALRKAKQQKEQGNK